MLCKICLRNQNQRNGGSIGLCWQHAKARCHICGGSSAGERNCIGCERKGDVERWKARANLRLIDPERELDFAQARREKLMQAKFHFHEAVEVLFQGFLRALEAIWGEIPSDQPEPPAVAQKKAA